MKIRYTQTQPARYNNSQYASEIFIALKLEITLIKIIKIITLDIHLRLFHEILFCLCLRAKRITEIINTIIKTPDRLISKVGS